MTSKARTTSKATAPATVADHIDPATVAALTAPVAALTAPVDTTPATDDPTALAREVRQGEGPIDADTLNRIVRAVNAPRFVLGTYAYAVKVRGVEGCKDGDASLTALASRVDIGRPRLSQMATAYGWIVDTGAPETGEVYAVALSAYDIGAAGRKTVRDAVADAPAWDGLTGEERAARWVDIRTDARTAQVTADAVKASGKAPATAPTDGEETAPADGEETAPATAPRLDDGKSVESLALAFMRDLRALVATVTLGEDDMSTVALDRDQQREASALIARLSSAVIMTSTAPVPA